MMYVLEVRIPLNYGVMMCMPLQLSQTSRLVTSTKNSVRNAVKNRGNKTASSDHFRSKKKNSPGKARTSNLSIICHDNSRTR
jgi:hypothetical protein